MKLPDNRDIGQRVVLEYFDQNISIQGELPTTGVIKSKIQIEKTDDNFLIELDQPIRYDNYDYEEIVIRRRHDGGYIGSSKEVHVHLLVPRVKLTKHKYHFDDFDHVAWLKVRVV